MVGYCSTGIERIDNPPASMTRIAMTIAKIGRSIKNLAIEGVLIYFALETTAPGEAFGASAAAMGDTVDGVDDAAAVAVCASTAFTAVPGFAFCMPATMTRSPSSSP